MLSQYIIPLVDPYLSMFLVGGIVIVGIYAYCRSYTNRPIKKQDPAAQENANLALNQHCLTELEKLQLVSDHLKEIKQILSNNIKLITNNPSHVPFHHYSNLRQPEHHASISNVRPRRRSQS